MRRHACFRSSITTAATSPSTMDPSISSSRRTSWSTSRTFTRPTAKSGGSYGRAVIACTSCPLTVGAFGPRCQHFLPHSSTPVRCRPNCCHASFLDPASSGAWPAPGCRSSTISQHPSSNDAMANAAISSPKLWLFHPSWWRRAFREDQFEIVSDQPMGLFYTGNMTLGARLSLARREKLAKVLGSACHIFKVQPVRLNLGHRTLKPPSAPTSASMPQALRLQAASMPLRRVGRSTFETRALTSTAPTNALDGYSARLHAL